MLTNFLRFLLDVFGRSTFLCSFILLARDLVRNEFLIFGFEFRIFKNFLKLQKLLRIWSAVVGIETGIVFSSLQLEYRYSCQPYLIVRFIYAALVSYPLVLLGLWAVVKNISDCRVQKQSD